MKEQTVNTTSIIIQHTFSKLVGIGFLTVGVLRFIAIPSVPDLSNPQPIHGIFHLITGAIYTLSGWNKKFPLTPHFINLWLGIIYVIAAWICCIGIFIPPNDNITHLGIGILSILISQVFTEKILSKKPTQ